MCMCGCQEQKGVKSRGMYICFADDLKHPGSEEIKNKAGLKALHKIQTLKHNHC